MGDRGRKLSHGGQSSHMSQLGLRELKLSQFSSRFIENRAEMSELVFTDDGDLILKFTSRQRFRALQQAPKRLGDAVRYGPSKESSDQQSEHRGSWHDDEDSALRASDVPGGLDNLITYLLIKVAHQPRGLG